MTKKIVFLLVMCALSKLSIWFAVAYAVIVILYVLIPVSMIAGNLKEVKVKNDWSMRAFVVDGLPLTLIPLLGSPVVIGDESAWKGTNVKASIAHEHGHYKHHHCLIKSIYTIAMLTVCSLLPWLLLLPAAAAMTGLYIVMARRMEYQADRQVIEDCGYKKALVWALLLSDEHSLLSEHPAKENRIKNIENYG